MRRLPLIVALVGATAVGVWAVAGLLDEEREDPRERRKKVQAPEAMKQATAPQRGPRRRVPVGAEAERPVGSPPTPERVVGDPMDVKSPAEAIALFDAVMADMETAIDAGGKLSEDAKAELYNRATGAYATLSAHADGADPEQRTYIEDAHRLMLESMRDLSIKPPGPERRPKGKRGRDRRDPLRERGAL